MTRAQYLQVRNEMLLIVTSVREMPLAEFLSAVDQAERDGPVQSPRMWTEGPEQLEKDRALAMALASLQRTVAT
jgi:hypothetical protein